MESIAPTDIVLFLGLGLLILGYSRRLHTRQSIAMVCGYLFLLVAKMLELTRGIKDLGARRAKQLGYSILLLSPSFKHWHDVFALIGYSFCIFYEFDKAVTPLALYFILGAESTTSQLSKFSRLLLGVATILGFKSPLQ
jgi:hypothetical protein